MAKLSEFGQAFADARKSGMKTFEFKGKKYGTKLASEVEQPSVGGKPKAGEYKTRAQYGDRDQEAMSSGYKPRRSPEDLTTTTKPGTNVNYENTDTSDMMKRGGKVKGYAKGGVTRADGCITKGHTKGRVI